MGIREKTDLNLQTVSLAGALFALLYFWAARRYTSDWRQRRLFKRNLIKTYEPLRQSYQQHVDPAESIPTNNSSSSNSSSSTFKKKRFVAAIPLMPLATAYVLARLAWDIFELLVFCSIDILRDCAAGSSDYSKIVYSRMVRFIGGLHVREWIKGLVIAVIENTVLWLVNTVFPCIYNGAYWCVYKLKVFFRWWVESGGPQLRDLSELVVFGYLVPAYLLAKQSSITVYKRLRWFGLRAWEALDILVWDVVYDLSMLYSWAKGVVLRIHNYEWQWLYTLASHLSPYLALLKGMLSRVKRTLADNVIPASAQFIASCAHAAFSYVLLPAFNSCVYIGDSLLQHSVSGIILVYSKLQTSLAWAHVLLPILEHIRISSWVASLIPATKLCIKLTRSYVHSQISYLVGLCHRSRWILDACQQAYSHVKQAVLIPAVSKLMEVAPVVYQAAIYPSIKCIYSGLVLICDQLRKLWNHMHVIGKFVHWIEAKILTTAHSVHLSSMLQGMYQCIVSSPLLAYIRDLAVHIYDYLGSQAGDALVKMGPFLWQSWNDSLVALRDMNRQLVNFVDQAVALVGDLLVDFAERNSVHSKHRHQ